MNPLRFLHGHWRGFLSSYRHISSFRWLILGVAVGLASGLAASAFYALVELGKHWILNIGAGLELPAPAGEREFASEAGGLRPWVVPVATTAVALLTGWLVQRFIPDSIDSGTDGTDAMIKAFHRQGGIIRAKTLLIKGITSVLTIASGGSAGREGPISQVGAGLGSVLARKLGLTAKERRLLLLAGSAGGLGAIFRAPLGGALTAVEVIYREDFEAEALLPAVLSSVTAYSLFTMFFGSEPIFGIPQFVFHDARELIFYAGLSVACSAAGWFYVRSFSFIKYSIFARVREKVGIMWATGLGGLCMGIIGMFYPATLTGGYGLLEQAILGNVTLGTMFALLLGKTIATCVTIGGGMSGGMFAPALFMGGIAGGIVGKVAHSLYPHLARDPGAYVLVGMAAFFAGVAKAPIGPLVMVTELTKGYGLLPPLMLTSALCLVLTRRVHLYEHQVNSKFESPAHVVDATINLLEDLKVQDYYKPGRVTTLEEGTTLEALTDIFANTNELYFPVKNKAGEFTSILSIHAVRNVLFEQDLFQLLVVSDVATKKAFLRPDYDLYTALLKFVDTGYGQIPVVKTDDDNEIIGLINREDVFKAYARAIQQVREDDA